MTENDRDFLLWAAKAAGIVYYARALSGGMLTHLGEWNPLIDDGAAAEIGRNMK